MVQVHALGQADSFCLIDYTERNFEQFNGTFT